MSGGNQQETKGANGKLTKAVGALREVEKVFPVASTMIEGLYGAKDAAKEEIEESLRGVRSSARAAQEKSEEAARSTAAMEERAARIEELAGVIETDSENAGQRAEAAASAAERAETAAKTVQDAMSSISTVDEAKNELKGPEAIALSIRRTENIPRIVVGGINAILKQQVRDPESGKLVEKKGSDLIAHLCSQVESATAAADAAVKDSEAARGKASESEAMVERAEAAASRAESAVEELKSIATSLDLKIKLLFRIMNGELTADQVVKQDGSGGKVTVENLIEAPVEEG